jgi:signal peptidase I
LSLTRRLIFGSNPRRTTVRILVLAVVSIVVFKWILIPIRTDGPSMLPTYRSGSLNLVNRLAYWRGDPSRGDVVAIRLAGPSILYIKRIVGLPGDRLEIADGHVRIDGVPLGEPYVQHRRAWTVPEVTLGPREYFVVGDNRGMRIGDHEFGRVDRSRIVGKVVF